MHSQHVVLYRLPNAPGNLAPHVYGGGPVYGAGPVYGGN